MDDVQKVSFTRNIHAYVKTQVQNGHQVQPKRLPCHVSAIKENDLIELTFDVTGPYTLPKIVVPQSFSKYHREPTQIGDPGFVLMGDFSLAGPSANPGGTASLHIRGNLTNAVFQPISNTKWPKKDPNMFLVTGGPSGHTTQSADGKTSQIIDALNNILHTSSNNIIHQAQQALAHIAGQTLTQASLGGVINHVAAQFTFGAPSSTAAQDLPTIPEPIQKTVMTVIGDLHATGMITTPTGSVGPGGSAGPQGPQGPQGPPGAPIQGTLPATITGAKGGNTALASLLAALVTMGLIVDHTTA